MYITKVNTAINKYNILLEIDGGSIKIVGEDRLNAFYISSTITPIHCIPLLYITKI